MNAITQPIYAETEAAAKVDRLEAALAILPQCDMPLTHRFTPGLYMREIFMPKGAIVISKIHKTEHPFVILKGRANVWIDGQGVVKLKAPHVGITKPGTRRVLYIPEDCSWITFHPTSQTDLEQIEDEVILKRPSTVQASEVPEYVADIINELRRLEDV